MKAKLGKIAITALTTIALTTGLFAQEDTEQKSEESQKPVAEETEKKKVNLEQRAAITSHKDPVFQTIVSDDKNKLFMEASNDRLHAGADINFDDVKVNVGYRHDDEIDDSRILLKRSLEDGFVGVEWQFLDSNDEHRFGMIGGITLNDNVSLEATVDTAGNARGVMFTKIADSLFAVGGGGNVDENWEINVSHSRKLIGNYNIWNFVRVGNDDFLDARLQLGKKGISPDLTRYTFSVTGSGFNEVSEVGDVTFPFDIGDFAFLGVECGIGSEPGDIGIDMRYKLYKSVYAHAGLNLGGFMFLKDIIATAKYTRDFLNNRNCFGVGGRTDVEIPMDVTLRLWYEAKKTESEDPEHGVYVGVAKEF